MGETMNFNYVPTTCPYCGCGCGLNLVVQDGKLAGVETWKRHPVSEGKLCPKGLACDEFVHSEERLTVPLIKKDGTFVESTWDEALALVAFSRLLQSTLPLIRDSISSATSYQSWRPTHSSCFN